MYRRSLLLLPALVSIAGKAIAQGLCTPVGTDKPSIAVRQAAGDANQLAFDFDVSYERRFCAASYGNERSLRLRFQGSQSFQSSVPDLNSMVGEAGVQGQRYVPRALSTTERTELLALRDSLAKALARGEELDSVLQERLGEISGRAASGGFLLEYDVHYRFEANQGVDTTQHALGARVISEIPFVHQFLDVIPAMTREPGVTPAQPVRASLVLDYLADADSTTIGALAASSNLWRLAFQTVWGTNVFDDLRLYADWKGHFFLDAPAAVRSAGLDFNSSIRVWLARRVGGRTDVVVQYVDGRFEPNYDLVSAGMIGFQILLGRSRPPEP